mmetsp:Transcript_44995/g.127017  ORF Transcript_44995/g.127017 Transcript_44995/m.127017 type:complete len:205 (-) Transcript_44995:857-1471(-)
MSTPGWLSAYVVKVCVFLVGMVVLRLISRVNTPPKVSMPKDRGVTSNRRMSFMSPFNTPPWMAAPMATASSGLTPLDASLPKKSLTISCTFGVRVMPPTRMTSLMSVFLTPESLMHCSQGGIVFFSSSSTKDSYVARVSLICRCFGPLWSAVMKGRLISVWTLLDSSILAVSAASLSRWRARRSLERSMPLLFLNSAIRWFNTR